MSNLIITGATLQAEEHERHPHTLTGEIRLHQNFHSRILGNDRDLIVYLPPDYAADHQRLEPGVGASFVGSGLSSMVVLCMCLESYRFRCCRVWQGPGAAGLRRWFANQPAAAAQR